MSLARIYAAAYAGLALAVVLILYVLYHVTFARDVIAVREPLRVLNEGMVYPGGHVIVELDYCKTFSANATTGAFLATQGVIVPLSVTASALPVGCHAVKLFYAIPEYVPPAVYTLYVSREYRLSLIEQRAYLMESEPFEVLPKAEGVD